MPLVTSKNGGNDVAIRCQSGTVGILDPTRVNQASYTISLNKNSEMYKDMSQKDFYEQVKEMSGKARTKVLLYIAHAIKAFVKVSKFIIKIPFFFK
jgi:hypothetical protein